MIISASRRTDIPAFFSDWFFKRIEEGFVLVRNPMNPRQVSQVSLKREKVDCFVFWTKNPFNMLPKLKLLEDYNYYFQFTLNPYGDLLETRVPELAQLIDVFKRLSDMLGPERVIWRYDPVIINESFNIPYHERYFNLIAGKLYKYTLKCIISFVDYYRKVDMNFKSKNISEINNTDKRELAASFSKIAHSNNIKLGTCSEDIDLSDLGIMPASCIDASLIGQLTGKSTGYKRDKNQRTGCRCIESIDIGTYNTCSHDCLYCYANFSRESVIRNIKAYDVNSPLLCSKLTDSDRIYVK